MTGKLRKKNQEWEVVYEVMDGKQSLPLHPHDVKQIEKDSQIFDNIEARIANNPRVQFEIVDEFTHPHLFEGIGWGDGMPCAKLM